MEEQLVDEDEIDDDVRLVGFLESKAGKSEPSKRTCNRKQGYSVVHNNGRCKRLRKIEGGCWMARSRRFKSAEEFEGMPEDTAYTHVCKVCWPKPKEDGDSSK